MEFTCDRKVHRKLVRAVASCDMAWVDSIEHLSPKLFVRLPSVQVAQWFLRVVLSSKIFVLLEVNSMIRGTMLLKKILSINSTSNHRIRPSSGQLPGGR
jgi:hypothetical protein